jgi:hypothetical protein
MIAETALGLASTGGGVATGAVVRMLVDHLQRRAEAAREDKERAVREKLALADKNIEAAKLDLEAPHKVETYESKIDHEVTLFGWTLFREKRTVKKPYTPLNPLAATRRMLALLIGATLCLIAILWSLRPDIPIHTRDYGASPNTTEWLWGFFRSSQDSGIVVVTTGSLIFTFFFIFSAIISFYYAAAKPILSR